MSAGRITPMFGEAFLCKLQMASRDRKVSRLLSNAVPERLQVSDLLDLGEFREARWLRNPCVLHGSTSLQQYRKPDLAATHSEANAGGQPRGPQARVGCTGLLDANSRIGVATMPHSDDVDHAPVIVQPVDDAEVADADAPQIS